MTDEDFFCTHCLISLDSRQLGEVSKGSFNLQITLRQWEDTVLFCFFFSKSDD